MALRPLLVMLGAVLVGDLFASTSTLVLSATLEQATQAYDLARGSGQKQKECVGSVRVGPSIIPPDLDATRVGSYEARIAIRGTNDSIICQNILHPAMQDFLKRSYVYFHNGTSFTLQQVLQPLLDSAKQPRIPQSTTSTPLEQIPLHQLHAVLVYQGTADNPEEHPLEAQQGIISLKIEKMNTPATLLLMSYYPVDWRVSLAPGASIESVILRGYYRQTIRGLIKDVPVNYASLEDDEWNKFFARSVITSRDGYLDFTAYVKSMFGSEPKTVQSNYTGKTFLVDGKASLNFQSPVEAQTNKPVRLTSKHESSARFRGRAMLSDDKLTAGYGTGGAYTESLASAGHSKGKWYAEFTVKAGPGQGVPNTWTDVGIRSSANENEGLVVSGGQLAYGVKRFMKDSGGLHDGDVIGLAMDFDQGHLYVRQNGTWIAGPPGMATSAIQIKTDREYVASVVAQAPNQEGSASDTWTANFGATPFLNTIPQGFQPYDGVQ